MEKVLVELSALIVDMNGEQRIIDNPQDVLEFESAIEGSKKMNGKKVYEAVLSAYYYASAFAYRLGTGGDLYGQEELDEEEMRKMTSRAAMEEAHDDEQAGSDGEKKSPPEGEGGVLKELDDLF